MAKNKVQKCIRNLTAVINVFFLGIGIVMIILGARAFGKVVDLENQASLFKVFNLWPLSLVLLLCGCGTVATSFAGFYGAKFRVAACMKAYAIILTLIIGLEFVMTGYMLNVSAGSVRTEWFQDDGAPQAGSNPYPFLERRIQVQNALHCCGFDYVWDSLLTNPVTPCNQPDNGMPPPPSTCKQAFTDYINTYIGPVATAAIVFASLEVVALICSCVVIFGSPQQKDTDDAFHY